MIKIVFSIILLFFSLASFCQKRIQFGVKAGPGLTKLRVKGFEDQRPRSENRITYHGGLFLRLPVLADGKLSVQPEVLYSRQGSQFTETTSGSSPWGQPSLILHKHSRTLNYLNIPLMILYGGKGVYVETGPQFGFLLNQKQEGQSAHEPVLNQPVDKNDFSWNIGAGHSSRKNFGFGFRYTLGIKNLLTDGDIANSRTLKNSVIMINFHYLIPY